MRSAHLASFPLPLRRIAAGWGVTLLALGLAGIAGMASAAGLADVVAATKPSVVAVGTFNPTASPRFGFRGTGFVVGSGNQVITNHHVLPGAEEIGGSGRLAIAVPNGADTLPEVRPATVQITDAAHDLALLLVEGPALPVLASGNGTLPREGTDVALIGFPLGAGLGLAPVTHRGIVAAVVSIALPAPTSRQLDAKTALRLRQGPFQVLQLDATAYPGNSGSPLVDAASGELLGVINLVLTKATKESAISSPTGITYAVPASHVHELLRAAGR